MLAILRPTKFWFFPLTRIGSCLSIAHQQSNLNSFGQYFGWSDPTGQLNYAVFAIILNNTCKLSKFENAVSLMISLTCFKLVFIDQFPRSFLQFFTVERKGKDCSDFFPLKTIMADYSVPVCKINVHAGYTQKVISLSTILCNNQAYGTWHLCRAGELKK